MSRETARDELYLGLELGQQEWWGPRRATMATSAGSSVGSYVWSEQASFRGLHRLAEAVPEK